MGLALDEPKADDERFEAEGFFFIAASEVADLIRSCGSLFIDYTDRLWTRSFQLSLSGRSSC